MARKRLASIEVGYQAFALGSEEEFGAVREVRDGALVIYIENKGDTLVPLSAVTDVVEQKVMVDATSLDAPVREAIARAHRDEDGS